MEVGFESPYLVAEGKKYLAGSGIWKRTVGVNGRCYYASAVNYALWGKMNRLCHDFLKTQGALGLFEHREAENYTLDNAIKTMQAWKRFKYQDFGQEAMQAEGFTEYGYNGIPSASPLACIPNGTEVKARSFDWCWEPMKRRPGGRK